MANRRTDNPGVYIIRLTRPAFGFPSGRVIYVGKGDDVEYRLRQELGLERGPASFFRSIGVLLGKTVIPGSGKNFSFYERDEVVAWLRENTSSEIIYCDWRVEERKLIRQYKPPLNYQYNAKNYYPGLRELRNAARRIGLKQG